MTARRLHVFVAGAGHQMKELVDTHYSSSASRCCSKRWTQDKKGGRYALLLVGFTLCCSRQWTQDKSDGRKTRRFHVVVAGTEHKLKVSRGPRASDSRMLHRCSMKHVGVSAGRARRPLSPAASAAKPPAPAGTCSSGDNATQALCFGASTFAKESGLAAFTSVAAPADRKAATQGSHIFYSKLYTGLARTAWPCESACVINTLIDHRPFLPFSTSCKQPHAHFLVLA